MRPSSNQKHSAKPTTDSANSAICTLFRIFQDSLIQSLSCYQLKPPMKSLVRPYPYSRIKKTHYRSTSRILWCSL